MAPPRDHFGLSSAANSKGFYKTDSQTGASSPVRFSAGPDALGAQTLLPNSQSIPGDPHRTSPLPSTGNRSNSGRRLGSTSSVAAAGGDEHHLGLIRSVLFSSEVEGPKIALCELARNRCNLRFSRDHGRQHWLCFVLRRRGGMDTPRQCPLMGVETRGLARTFTTHLPKLYSVLQHALMSRNVCQVKGIAEPCGAGRSL